MSPARELCSRNLTEECKDRAGKRVMNSKCGRTKESPREEVPSELSVEGGREFPRRTGRGGVWRNHGHCRARGGKWERGQEEPNRKWVIPLRSEVHLAAWGAHRGRSHL